MERGRGKRDKVGGPPWPLSRSEGGGLAVSPWMSSHAVMAWEQCFAREMARVSSPSSMPPSSAV